MASARSIKCERRIRRKKKGEKENEGLLALSVCGGLAWAGLKVSETCSPSEGKGKGRKKRNRLLGYESQLADGGDARQRGNSCCSWVKESLAQADYLDWLRGKRGTGGEGEFTVAGDNFPPTSSC